MALPLKGLILSIRAFYGASIQVFLAESSDSIIGKLVQGGSFSVETTQRDAWLAQIQMLRATLARYAGRGKLYFEYSVPRMGKRIDVVALVDHVVFVIEFKIGERDFTTNAIDQVWDYALDLKNFHEASHNVPMAPVLVATNAAAADFVVAATRHNDNLLLPICVNETGLAGAIESALAFLEGSPVDAVRWEAGRYCPTPTIIEAALVLYSGHSVDDISRNDASAINLSRSSEAIAAVIRAARATSSKAICFLTGVPGAGKTLVGLNIATKHIDPTSELYSVFLSGNGPLVSILREALARDRVARERSAGRVFKKGQAQSEVRAFVQNVHNFRDECLKDPGPPVEHVALFDEAQRAWNVHQTAKFMRAKRGRPDFNQSEPEFLLSCMNRHRDWAVVVCLVGGGQEINTGEAGIGEWIRSLQRSFPEWHLHISSRLHDTEYGAGEIVRSIQGRSHVHLNDDLHLSVSMRSFRAENVSAFVKALLDRDEAIARDILQKLADRYPIVATRDPKRAKLWLKEQARGSERYGIVVSSEAQRLKPHAIDIRSPMSPIHWFLGQKDDVRSSYYLEDVATEFHVQGLELDWAGVIWDADFRASNAGWGHFSFVGNRWNRIKKEERQAYLKNAYRVLLTRARQGMVIVVPDGDDTDATRHRRFYDPTFELLRRVGVPVL